MAKKVKKELTYFTRDGKDRVIYRSIDHETGNFVKMVSDIDDLKDEELALIEAKKKDPEVTKKDKRKTTT